MEINVVHRDGFRDIEVDVARALGHCCDTPDKTCRLDLFTGLLTPTNNPFWRSTVSIADAVEQCKSDIRYICLINKDDISDAVLDAWLRINYDPFYWRPCIVTYMQELIVEDRISSAVMKKNTTRLINLAMWFKNPTFLNKILSSCGPLVLHYKFWIDLRSLLDQGKDITEYVAAITNNHVKPCVAVEVHLGITNIIIGKGLEDKHHGLISWFACAYNAVNNSHFIRKLSCKNLDIVTRLYREGLVHPSDLPRELYDKLVDGPITSNEEFVQKFNALLARYC